MNGAHDVGGLTALGPIPIGAAEAPFAAPWQGRVVALTLASVVRRLIGVDRQRAAVEAIHPVAYMAASYHQRWLRSLEENLVANGVVERGEIEERLVELAEQPDRPAPSFDDGELVAAVRAVIERGIPVRDAAEVDHEPRYRPGQAVRTKVVRVRRPGAEHTRLPAYAQDKRGEIEIVHPPQPLGEDVVAGRRERPEFVYSVRFSAAELWPDRYSGESVNLDVWESYMEPAEGQR